MTQALLLQVFHTFSDNSNVKLEINEWAEESTNGKISELFTEDLDAGSTEKSAAQFNSY